MNRTHTDSAVLSWAVDTWGIKSMVDVGCGPGGMKQLADVLDISYIGIDGDYNIKKSYIITHDFTAGPLPVYAYDLCWSVEFVEHVHERYMQNYISVFKQSKHLIMTFAPPGKKGIHHVNLQPEKYWINVMERSGFSHSPRDTQIIRSISSMKREFMRNTGLVFHNEN